MNDVPIALLLSLAICATLPAQTAGISRNVRRLGQFNPSDAGGFHNDVWGWTDPKTGREAAIMGSTNGFYVIETTNPYRPIRRGWFPSTAPWKPHVNMDLRVWRGFAYVITEGGAGMKIVDVRDLDRPRLVKLWGTEHWTHAHEFGLAPGRGLLIVCGVDNKTLFVDVETDPLNPKLVLSFEGRYVHDAVLKDGLLHTADIVDGYYSIYDAKAFPKLQRLSQTRTVRDETHTVSPSYDNKICVVSDENHNGGWVTAFDIVDPSQPKTLSYYRTGPAPAISHNAFLLDYVAHVTYFTEGYRCVDFSDPKNPVEVGFYDTYALPFLRWMGAWGCYWQQPSGVIYVSDRNTGLYILKPRATSTRYGVGTPNSAGRRPHVHAIGSAYLGNRAFKIGVRNAKERAVAVLVIGRQRADLDVGGLRFHVYLLPAPILLASATGDDGRLLLPVPIPGVTDLDGTLLDVQWFVFDADGPFGLTSSEGLEFELFER